MPRVSVVIACFNHGKFIDEAVESILAQTYQDFEIIVVDDGSNDERTTKLLHSLVKPKTKVIFTPHRGPSAARNTGTENSVGDYILILDADDKFEATFLEKAVKLLDVEPDLGVVTCEVQHFGQDKSVWIPSGGDVRNFLVLNAACGNSLFRKLCWTQVSGYDDSLSGYEDWDYWISVTARGWKVRTIPEPLFLYRKHATISRYETDSVVQAVLKKRIVAKHQALYVEHYSDLMARRQARDPYLFGASFMLYLLLVLPGALENLGISASDAERQLHDAIALDDFASWTSAQVRQAGLWLNKLTAANGLMNVYPHTEYCRVLANRWWLICTGRADSSISNLWRFSQAPLSAYATVDGYRKVRFLLRCVRNTAFHHLR